VKCCKFAITENVIYIVVIYIVVIYIGKRQRTQCQCAVELVVNDWRHCQAANCAC